MLELLDRIFEKAGTAYAEWWDKHPILGSIIFVLVGSINID
jgi:hypothetical protein